VALVIGLLALVAAGLLWRWFRIRLGAIERQWGNGCAELRTQAVQARVLAEEAHSRLAATEASATDSAAAARSAVRAAEFSARSAAQSAISAAETAGALRAVAESGRRAWVHAVDFKLTLKTQQPDNSSLDIAIANLGATPARELKVSTNFLICDETSEDPPLKLRVSNVALGPGVSFSLSHFLRVSQADLVSVSTGRRVLLCCGKAQYRDVFDIERETRWCTQYDFTAKTFMPASKHNLTI
jgi:hypothetical protein